MWIVGLKGLIEYQRQDVSSKNMYIVSFNSDSTQICILLVFLKVKSPKHIFLQLYMFMFFSLSIPPSFLLF